LSKPGPRELDLDGRKFSNQSIDGRRRRRISAARELHHVAHRLFVSFIPVMDVHQNLG
jgi:hypothetical protein